MPDSFLTLADLIKVNDPRNADIEVSDLINRAVLLSRLAATPASNGNTHQYTKEVDAPVVGFREPNVGREYSKSGDELVTIALKILSANTRCDKALADIFKNGPEAYIGKEARRHLREAFFVAERQLIYGTGAAADGFVGLAQTPTVRYTDSEMVINATGTTAATATSVWAICSNSDESDVTVVAGRDGEINIGDTQIIEARDATGKHYPAYYTPIEGWLGLQIGSKYSVARIVNLTNDSGKGLTDTLLSRLLELFPADRKPVMLAMSRRSRGQLQRSRQTYSPTGAPAPLPQEYEGVPIVVAESISNTEAIVTAEPEE